MVLHNVNSLTDENIRHIQVNDGLIQALGDDLHSFKILPGEIQLELNDSLMFPGLINSHDHLDFNLFPQTGNLIYTNYTEWARDINKHNKVGIDVVLKIPRPLRTQYGVYKNLLNGFTTVVNHGEHLIIKDSPINVFQDSYSLHSIHFENNWKYQLNRLFKKKGAFVIHVGEGTDKASCKEIDKLTKWNLFKRKLIAVHGVAMNETQAAQFHAVVWCPASNIFLLNCTAPVAQLKKYTNIIFGTDSTLTAPWNIWEQLRQARKTNMLNDRELFDSLTTTPAAVWELNSGSLAENKSADLVIAKKKDGLSKMDNFYSLDPEDILLVMHKGNIRLFDDILSEQLRSTGIVNNFNQITIGGQNKFVEGDLPGLLDKIKTYGQEVSFAITKSFIK